MIDNLIYCAVMLNVIAICMVCATGTLCLSDFFFTISSKYKMLIEFFNTGHILYRFQVASSAYRRYVKFSP